MGAMHTIRVGASGGRSYDVVVGQGLLDRADEFLPRDVSSIALICDHRVAELYGDRVESALLRVGQPVTRIEFPAGEASKTRATKERIEDAMFQAGLDRSSLVVALGGGVTSDLAGFAAATYMRGIRTVNLPTTLLAMVDATVGGKTGVDTPAGKNLVGAFHSPLAVVVDLASLSTLEPDQWLNGLAEMIKHAVIADVDLLERIETLDTALSREDLNLWGGLVAQAVFVKTQVVMGDPLEANYRQVLNFGHTVGHALELLSDWRLGHGRAVALGMAAEAEISYRMGLLAAAARDRIRLVLGRFDLLRPPPEPVLRSIEGKAEPFLQAMTRDKKNRGGQLRMALPKDIGEMVSPEEFWDEDDSFDEAEILRPEEQWTVEVSPGLVAEVVSDLWGHG